MATLYERLPIAPDPSLQEPAGESELDSLSHRPSRSDLGNDGTMPSRGTPPACYEIPNDTHPRDIRYMGYSSFDDITAAFTRNCSPSPFSYDDDDHTFVDLHGARTSTSPPTPECDGSTATIGMFELQFGEEYERASTFLPHKREVFNDTKSYEAPPDDKLPPRRRRRLPEYAMIENEEEEENALIVSRSDGYLHLACPFSVAKPEKYKSCLLHYSLQSIEDIIRHVTQHHKEPPYCPICRREFDSPSVRDQHVLTRTCTFRDSGEVKDINERQPLRLHKQDVVHIGERKRWSHIWETVFPDSLSLKPSYLYEIKNRAMLMINSYWGTADTIMSNEQPNDIPHLYSLILQIPGAVCGLAWGDSYNQRKNIKIQDIGLGGRHRQPIFASGKALFGKVLREGVIY
uniref:C2H2-type domain-containing protein n=1 Tax=Bionectria ochroleuca TaxID=29856 RepID=A0A0B7K7U8_BIOOC